MTGVLPIAAMTFRAVLRDRVLTLLLALALLTIALSKAVGWVTPSEDVKVVTDLSLASLSLFTVLLAVFLGARLVREDVERRALYAVLSKDVSRLEVILGKYVGLTGALALSLAAAAAAAAVYVAAMGGAVGAAFLAAVVGVVLELMVLVAASVFFSTVASAPIAAVATATVYVVGHGVEVLREFRDVWEAGAAKTAAGVLYVLLPNLAALDFRIEASHALPVDAARLALAAGAAAAWSAVFLAAAALAFRRRDL
ncbi:MAG: hypothetical protein L0216_17945 [Planctomycetales bacterium]|nr:hypothetical protein [Planctomycetales bacterium]